MRNVAQALVVLSMLLARTAAAQAQEGAIAGQVLDATGDVLRDVRIEATNPVLLEGSQIGVTDVQGRYNILDLPPGAHTATFSLPGFGTVVRDSVELGPRFGAAVNVQLPLGAIEERLTLSGGSPAAYGEAGVLLNCGVDPDGTVGSCRRSVVIASIHLVDVPRGRLR